MEGGSITYCLLQRDCKTCLVKYNSESSMDCCCKGEHKLKHSNQACKVLEAEFQNVARQHLNYELMLAIV
jgi:hypothetical protein